MISTTPRDAYFTLIRQGFRLWVENGRLRVKPADRITPHVDALIRANNVALVELLREPVGWEEDEEGPRPAPPPTSTDLPAVQRLSASPTDQPVKPELLTEDELSSLLDYEIQFVRFPADGRLLAPAGSSLDDDADGWGLLSDEQREHLLNPPSHQPSCRHCGRFGIHAENCADAGMVIKIGKHRGRQIRTLPTDYLLRLLDWSGLREDVRVEIRRETHIRGTAFRDGRPAHRNRSSEGTGTAAKHIGKPLSK